MPTRKLSKLGRKRKPSAVKRIRIKQGKHLKNPSSKTGLGKGIRRSKGAVHIGRVTIPTSKSARKATRGRRQASRRK